jgi:hypothetical protein
VCLATRPSDELGSPLAATQAPLRLGTPNSHPVLHLIDRIVGPLRIRVDESSPWADARLPDGSRVHTQLLRNRFSDYRRPEGREERPVGRNNALPECRWPELHEAMALEDSTHGGCASERLLCTNGACPMYLSDTQFGGRQCPAPTACPRAARRVHLAETHDLL